MDNCTEVKVVASLNLLFHGCHPERPILDCNGHCDSTAPAIAADKPLRILATGEKMMATVTEIRGDWKYMKDTGYQRKPLLYYKFPLSLKT